MRSCRNSVWLVILASIALLCGKAASASVWYVSVAGSDSNAGTSWATAVQSIPAAITLAQTGDQIWVQSGVYIGKISLNKSIGFYGGFAGAETQLTQRNPSINVTILDGNQTGSVLTLVGLTSSAVIDGFTIRNGNSSSGGGIHNISGSPTISNNTITGNSVSYGYGGGVYSHGSGSPVFRNNVVTNNTVIGSNSYGGGMGISNPSATLIGNTIEGNTSSYLGGGVGIGSGTLIGNKIIGNAAPLGGGLAVSGTATVKYNVFYGNHASQNGDGGALALESASATTVTNNIFDSNDAGIGSAVYSQDCTTTIANNTIVNNAIYSLFSSVIYNQHNTYFTENVKIANNVVAFNGNGISDTDGNALIVYNDIFSNGIYAPLGQTVTSGIYVDPQFTLGTRADYRPAAGSPLIDAGNAGYVNAGDFDFAGNLRSIGGSVDIGAYEYPAAPAAVSLSSIVPASTPINTVSGTPDLILTLNGIGFAPGATAFWNGLPLVTSYVSPAQLSVSVPSTQLSMLDMANVSVVNPDTSASNALLFPVANPAPTLSAVSPAGAVTNDPALTLTVTGMGFLPSSVVYWGIQPLVTTYVSSTTLTAAVPYTINYKTGPIAVTVATQLPGGGSSNAVNVNVANAAPVVTSLNPNFAITGSSGFMLIINGSGFCYSSVVNWNGTPLTTVFNSANQLSAVLPADHLANDTTASVTVTNPAPGGGTSANVAFSVLPSQVATLTSITPSYAIIGSPDTVITLNGSGFVNSSTAQIGGNYPQTLNTTYISPTQLTATIPASDLTSIVYYSIFVNNPVIGGGASNSLAFQVQRLAPVITSISPTLVRAGGPSFQLTVNGANFTAYSPTSYGDDGSYITWNGQRLQTISGSTTKIVALVPDTDIATAGTATIVAKVTQYPSPIPSNAVTLSIISETGPPVTTATLSGAFDPANADYLGPVQVTLSATDPDGAADVVATYYQLDGGAQTAYTVPFSVTGNSQHTVTYWSVDQLGSIEAQHTKTFWIQASPPYTYWYSYGDSVNYPWYKSTAYVVLFAYDSSWNPNSGPTYYQLDGGAQQTYSSPIPVSGDGQHNVTFWSVDQYGNAEDPKSATVAIDSISPNVFFYSPSPTPNAAGWYSAPVSVPFWAFDGNSGIWYTTPGNHISVSSEGMAQTGTVTAYDLAGNVTYANTPPVNIDMTSPVTAAAVTGGTVTLTATDTLSGVAATYFTIDGGTQQTYTAPLTVTGVGLHTLTYHSTDVAGNAETDNTTTVTIYAPISTFTVSPTSLTGGALVKGTVRLASAAPPGGETVTIQSGNAAIDQGQITLAAGATTGSVSLPTHGVGAATPVTLTATAGGVSKTATVTVNPAGLNSVTVSPNPVNGGVKATCTVSLTGQAAVGGTVVGLSSSDGTTIPAGTTVTIPAGATSATYAVTPAAVNADTSITITAARGSVTKSVVLTVKAPVLTILTVPATVLGGSSAVIKATIGSPAPAGGLTVGITSNSGSLTVGSGIIAIAAGSTSGTLTASTVGVNSDTPVTVNATCGSVTKTGAITVKAAALSSLTLSPTSVYGGVAVVATVRLGSIAGPGGVVITLASSDGTAIPAGTFVTVPAGATTSTYRFVPAATDVDTPLTLTATQGTISKTAALTIRTPVLAAFVASSASLHNGQSVTFKATLSSPAPAGGAKVNLFSNSSVLPVPGSMTVLAGATIASVTVTATGATATSPVTVSASRNSISKTLNVTVAP